MGMVVRTNTMAINANRQLGMNNSAVAKSLEKLSSGFKINRAADDASGLAISEKMKAQIKGLDQASANSQDGISLIQTAEGAATEIHDMLNRMVELATKSANGTIQDEVDREAIQREVDDLNSEISRIAQSTNFNGIDLLNGNLSAAGGASGTSSVNYKGIPVSALANSTPSKATFESDAVAAQFDGNTDVGGKSISFTVALDNGKNYTVSLTVDKENNTLVAADGTTYASGAANKDGKATQVKASEAIAAELQKKVGEGFTVTAANNKIKLTASEDGSQTTKVVAFGETKTDGTAAAQKNTVTAGVDKYKELDVEKLNLFDGTNAEDAVFSINGQKFAIVASDATADDLAKLDKNVTVVTSATAKGANAKPAAADAAELIKVIKKQTGLTLAEKTGATGTINMVDTTTGAAKTTGGLTLQVGDTNASFNSVTVSVDDLSAKGIGTEGLDVSTQPSAGDAIQTIKDAINQVSTNRANLGSLQNRLEHTINNLDTTSENMSAANSRIRDTDMAKEMMNYTKMNVLVQSAQAMLAQANQQPQSILQLLQ